jgi:tRNA nucleotidyltransferase (CCA-adding enzyme)
MAEPRIHIPARTLALLRPLARLARREHRPLYAVGGCVRDWLLGRQDVKDLDLVTEGNPSDVAKLAARMLGGQAEAFDAFGTLRVKGGDWRVDFAASRQERYPEPACLPQVKPAPLERDLFRRDFTINAMAVRLAPEGAGALVDPYGGLRDLKARVLRVLHPASFRDDPTRVFRAARFLCRLGLRPAPGFDTMVRQSLYGCIAGRLSRHRIAQELLRILAEEEPRAPLRRLRSWGYLDLVYPDLPVQVEGASVEERLGSLVLALGEKGEEFLAALPVERSMARSIKEAWRIAQARASPRTPIPPAARCILSVAFPHLPKAAFEPLMIGGREIMGAGVKEGLRFRSLLDAAARAQWAGKLSSRGQALTWLEKKLRETE